MFQHRLYFLILLLFSLLTAGTAQSADTPSQMVGTKTTQPATATTPATTNTAPSTPSAGQPATTSSPQLEGQIQQSQSQPAAPAATQQTTITDNTNNIEALFSQILGVTKTPVTLQGDLGKNYNSVQITLKNNQPCHLSILQGEVLNAVDENLAVAQIYQEEYNKAAKRQRGASIFGGLLSTAASFIPYAGGVAGYATSAAMGAASDVAGMVGSAGGPEGYAGPSGQFIRQIHEVIISPGDVYQFSTLMPKGMTPQLKLIIKNLQSNEIVTMQR